MLFAVAILLGVFRQADRGRGKSNKAWSTRRSRRADEHELLEEWVDFENFMKSELYGKSGEAPLDDLSGIVVDFSLRYDLNPEEIRSVLRVRNAIVYERKLSSSDEVQRGLSELQLIFEKLRPLWDNDQYSVTASGDHIFASSGAG